jgi:uncharacterized repeat protein (TIGR01451 family)
MIRMFAKAFARLLLVGLGISLSVSPAAAFPPPIQTFYVPLPEDQLMASFVALSPGLGDTTVRTTIAITAAGNGTFLYYDHWEDGYEADIANPVQATTQVWGDSNLANGAPPGCAVVACDVVNAGRVITLQNDVFVSPRDPGTILFDGRDKIGSTLLIAVTQAGWPIPTGTVLADAIDVSSTNEWGTVYEAPGGEDISPSSPMFEDSRFIIMAQRDGTIVRVDIDDDGSDDIVQTLNEGETLLVDGVLVGTRVFANLPVQVSFLTGDIFANYESRWYAMVPRNRWSDSYIAPVGTTVAGDEATVLLYNPHNTALSVDVTTTAGSSTVSVPAGGLFRFFMPMNSGALFQSTDGREFFAIANIDDEGPTHDWGHRLLPATTLAPAVKAGWAPGSDTPATENSSPIWVTAASATTLNVDWNDDGTVDTTVAIGALQSVTLRDPDGDQTGARIFTTDGTLIAAAWGQDPNGASAAAPAIDAGTAVLPAPDVSILKNSTLAQDLNGNGLLDPGDTLRYTLFVLNTGVVNADNVVATDVPDPYTTYVLNTTLVGGAAYPDDVSPSTPFPLDEAGINLGTLTPGQGVTITYERAVGDPLPSPQQQIINTAQVTYGTGVLVSTTHVSVVAPPQFNVTKSSDVAGLALPGQTVQYTLAIQNTSPFTQTGISVTDALPAGTTYVAESTTATGAPEQTVADLVNAAAYNNNDGTRNWSTDWVEGGDDGNVNAGDVRVLADLGSLRLVVGNDTRSLTRSANLIGFPAATLSFFARRVGLDSAAEYVAVQVSANAGPFVEVARFAGAATDAAYSFYNVDITPYISGNTQIRFASPAGGMSASDQVFFDDVRISSRPLQTYRDLFNAQSFANSDGTLNWTTAWTEIGEPPIDVGPATGDIRVATDTGALRLVVQDDDNAVRRQADLTGFTSATLSFLYRRESLDDATEEVQVRVSGDGGASFTQIAVYENGNDTGYTLAQFDISAFISANTVIEFRTPPDPGMTGSEGVFFDSIQIVGPLPVVLVKTNQAGDPNPLLDGDPPNLVLAGDGFTLAPGETMIVTYSVRIDDPLVPFLPAILNLASVDSNESLTPTLASRLDPVAPGSILGDRVWLDVDGDGVQDIGEVGLSNVRVRLFRDPDGVPGSGDEIVLGSLFTDGNGNYLFNGVYPPPSGTVYVEVDATTLPAGLVPSPGNNGGRGPSLAITGSDTFLDVDFGYTTAPGTAVAGDRVWSDADNDGIQDPGEIGIGAVSLALVAPGADGIFGTGDDVVAGTTMTAADGTYLFVGVAPGVYRVDVTDAGGVLAGYTLTVGPQSSTDPTTSITLAAGAVDVSRDFGYRNPSLLSIADAVWDDADGDGVRDAGEAGISGVTVALRDGAGNLVGTTASDANGDFQFAGLGNGSYTIDLTDTGGLLTSLLATTAPATAGQLAVTVAGANIANVSFGYRDLGAIGEIVWSDADGDGVRDFGEPGIAGVTLDLVIAGLDGLFGTPDDSVLATRTTAADGTYRFTAVPRGYYRVVVTDSGGVLSGFTQTGDPDATLDDQGDVPLLAGAVDLTMNFGYQNTALADASGTVFDDTDLDGILEPGENGIPGVSLDLVAPGPDGIYGTIDDLVLATTFSDGGGNYIFTDVPNGSYRVIVTDTGNALNGYTLTSGLDQIPVSVSGADVTGVDFGYARTPGTGSIGRRVWLDANRDGVQNPSEDGIPNVTLNLRSPGPDGILGNGDDVTVASATTDANGYYIFTGLAAGDYYVDLVGATLPAGLAPTVGTTDPTGLIQLSDGQAYIGANFGYASAVGSALGDSVFFDANRDGFQDPGEPGIGGVGVAVTGPSGTFNVVTTPAGFWLVAGLAPGTYTVTVDTATLPPGYNTTPTNGPASRNFPVAAGSDFLRADFGFDAPAGVTGSIGDTVFFDANGNGVQDGGESGIAGVTLRLLDAGGSVVATATTDVNGAYDFNGLPPANYRVEVTDVFGALAGLNLSAGTNPSGVVTLGAGADVDTVDFGYAPSGGTGSIGGFVWHDGDGSGAVDGAESTRGIQGVTIDLYLDVNGNGVLDPGIDNLVRSAVTDVIGEYQAFGLPPGDYLVDVTDANGVLAGFSKTSGVAGADNNSQADPYPITLASGASNFTADFGYLAAGTNTISGTTFFDVAGDGLFNGNDTGIGAVTVYLYRDLDGDGVLDATDPRIGLLATDASGNYAFANLPDGSFIVAVDVTGTFLQSSFQTTQALTGGVQPVVLSGASSSGNHFGFNITATLVTLTRFDAYEENGKAVVEWVTGSEVGTLGFYVFRWDPASRAFVQVNDTLLPGLRSPQGGLYRLVDETAPKLGRAAYVLFEAEEGGGTRHYGPFQVRLGEARRGSGPLSPMTGAFERRARRQTLALVERAERAAARRAALRESPLRARRQPLTNGAAMKLTVPEEGAYFVAASEIAAALSQPEAVVRAHLSRGNLDLRNLGREAAWLPAADGSGLWFFGERLETAYTAENAYWLQLGRGRRMNVGSGTPEAQGPGFYAHRTHLERDVFPATLASSDPDADFWYWSSLMASLPQFSTGTYTLGTTAVEAAGGGASLDVSVFGATSTPHRLRIRANGVVVGEGSFEGVGARTMSFDLDASLLAEGSNTIEVQSLLEPGTAFDVVYLESLDLSYPRRHEAIEDALRFTAADSGAASVSGFTADDAVVLDVTDPVSPILLAGIESIPGTVRFQAEAGRSYFAYSSRAVKTPESSAVETLSSLRAGAADYLVVAPRSLAQAAQELARYREGQGLHSRVVTLETIYDELGFGIRSPHHVKAFLRQARSWSVSPRFVVLVGKGTYDYKDALGKGDNLMPPLMAATPQGLYSSDNRLADIEGDDGVPDLSIGRIPVLSDDELSAYVAKLADFESSGMGAALFAADNPDVAGDFTRNSEEVIDLVPDDVSVERVYLGTLPIGAARAALFDRLTRGVSFWNYIGHGGLDRFASEGLVLTTDVPGLSNTTTPILASLTCSVGRFEIPGWSSLAEALVTKEAGGVVAAWSPSGLSNDAQAMILNQTFVEAIYRPDTQYLGDAISSALGRFSAEGQLRYMLSIYNLLGDPATRLR